MDLSNDTLTALQAQTPETLAQWWCLLNRFEWPAELPDEEPVEEYDALMLKRGGPGVCHSRRGHVMRWIEGVVPERALSREWNRDRMTDEEFDDFWRGNHEGDAEAKARDEARTWAGIYLKGKWPTVLLDENDWPDEIELE